MKNIVINWQTKSLYIMINNNIPIIRWGCSSKGDGYFYRDDEDFYSLLNPWYHYIQHPLTYTSSATSSKIPTNMIW